MPDPLDHLKSALADRYRIEREIGRGGMATVYLAEDLRHRRKVAIKVLRPELAAVLGPDRFLREIEIAAGLNHPHILPLHDSGDADGVLYYVMPFAEGESLRTRLAREGELPVSTAVRILRDVVDALAAAHRQGVIHRDIKPDNVMLLDNHAVVTDFGIAKAVSEATGREKITTAGIALGTPLYMAPEQAVADPHVDHRADIYAVGVVAYEMLTGRPPITGNTPQEVLAAQVADTPEHVTTRREAVPAALGEAVMRCLAKKPADRWQSADDLLRQIEGLSTPSVGMTPTTMAPAAPAPHRRTPMVLTGIVAVAVVALAAWWAFRPSPTTYVFGRSEAVTADPGLEIQPALSPDGRFVAYAAGGARRMRVYIRTAAGGRTIPLSDDSTAVEYQPRWSPDGNQLLYLTHGGVSVAPALGGTGRPVVASASAAAWSPDGNEIAFVRGEDSLFVVSVSGGMERFVAAQHETHTLSWSPDGRWIAGVTGNGGAVAPGRNYGNLAPSKVIVLPAAGGTPIEITGDRELNESPVWSPDSRRLFFISNRDGPSDVYVQEITSSGAPRGAPIRLTTGLDAQSISLSADGARLAYNVYSARGNIWSLPIPSAGPVTPDAATQVTTGNQLIESMRVSSDGSWLVYDSDLRGNADIFRVRLDGSGTQQLTSEPWDEFAPDLSPDGRLVAYHSFRTGTRDIEVKPLDGSPAERVTDSPQQESYPLWSPDGTRLLYWDQEEPNSLVILTRLGPGEWSAPDTVALHVRRPRWSADGRDVAYFTEDTTGGALVTAVQVTTLATRRGRIVYRFPDTRIPGLYWAPDGRLYFKDHDDQGRAVIARIVDSGRAIPLVRFTDLNRPSNRRDFAATADHFYFTFEERESDVFVVEVTRE